MIKPKDITVEHLYCESSFNKKIKTTYNIEAMVEYDPSVIFDEDVVVGEAVLQLKHEIYGEEKDKLVEIGKKLCKHPVPKSLIDELAKVISSMETVD